MKIDAFYFSGTGNTKYIVKYLKEIFSDNKIVFNDYKIGGTEEDFTDKICDADIVLFAFPVHSSRPPEIVMDFVNRYENVFLDKDILIAATQMIASGDTAAFFSRRMKKLGAHVLMGEHFKMPNNVSDTPFLRIKSDVESVALIKKTEKKLDKFFEDFMYSKKYIRGNNLIGRCIGGVQRIFTAPFKKRMSIIKINMSQCNFCRKCVRNCPAHNIIVSNDRVKALDKCTSCYRCINNCEKQAISLLSRHKPSVQYKAPEFENNNDGDK